MMTIYATYRGYDENFNALLDRTMKRKSTAGGYSFVGQGISDREWEFTQAKAAHAALARLKKIKSHRLRCKIISE